MPPPSLRTAERPQDRVWSLIGIGNCVGEHADFSEYAGVIGTHRLPDAEMAGAFRATHCGEVAVKVHAILPGVKACTMRKLIQLLAVWKNALRGTAGLGEYSEHVDSSFHTVLSSIRIFRAAKERCLPGALRFACELRDGHLAGNPPWIGWTFTG